MYATKVAAQFAAYVWFLERSKETPTTADEALCFARRNWEYFLPCAHEGLGRLLIRIAGTEAARQVLPRRTKERNRGRTRLFAAVS